MKGNEKLIQKLDQLLADELAAINQYIVHSEMCANWGYDWLEEQLDQINQMGVAVYLSTQTGN